MLPTARFATAVLAGLLLVPGSATAKTTFSNTRALTFGKFVPGTGGSVTVDPAGVRTRSGGVILVSSTVSSASFSYSDNTPKNANNVCVIGLPTTPVTLSSGTSTMTLDTFRSNPSPTGQMSGGNLTFTVGATLTVAPNQPKGNYSGSFSVTIQYQ